MRFHLTEIITRPEPASAPAGILFIVLISAAALAAAVGAIIGALA